MAEATRAVSDALDAADVIVGEYTLDVMSPGVDRPLTRAPSLHARGRSHLVTVTLADGSVAGRPADRGGPFGDDAIVVVPVTPGLKGRKPVVGEPLRVSLSTCATRTSRWTCRASALWTTTTRPARRRCRQGELTMDIDMQTLRLLEREREISLDVLVSAIEQALLSAYHRTPGAQPRARVEVDRKTGHVTVWAREPAPLGEPDDEGVMPPPGPDGPEYDDTPDGFGRIATATARQVIVQRLRDAEDDQVLGAFRGKEGEVLGGVIQQGRDPRTVLVDVGGTEAVLPAHEQVPGEEYVHGDRIRGYVLEVARGQRGPQVTLSRTHPNLVRKLFELEVPEVADGTVEITAMAREAGHRTKMAVRANVPGVNAKGACIGPMGGRVRASWRSCTARRSTSSTTPTTPPR